MVSSAERVTRHTPAEINRRIRAEMEDRIAYFTEHPDGIPARLIAGSRRRNMLFKGLEVEESLLAV